MIRGTRRREDADRVEPGPAASRDESDAFRGGDRRKARRMRRLALRAMRTSLSRAGAYSMRKGLSGGAQVRTCPVCDREKRLITGHIDLE